MARQVIGEFVEHLVHQRFVRHVAPFALAQRGEERVAEIVAGEHCAWFDVWPNVMDAGLHQCRTNDGIVLREHRMSRMHYEPLIAVRIERAPIYPAKIMPPRDILSRAAWGIPE